MLSKKLTLVLHILLFAAFLAMAPLAAATPGRCADIFKFEHTAKTHQDWVELFASLDPEIEKIPRQVLKKRLRPVDDPTGEVQDGRLYRMNEVLPKDAQLRHHSDPSGVQVNIWFKTGYSYLYSGFAGTLVSYHTFRSQADGRVFTTPTLPAHADFRDHSDLVAYEKILTAFLQKFDTLSRSTEMDPRLDFYFDRWKTWDQKEEMKTLYWDEASRYEVTTEAHFLSNLDNSPSDRYLTRQIQEHEGYFVEVIETRAKDPGHDGNSIEDAMVGRRLQRKWLAEIMATVLPEYVTRRGWSLDFIKIMYKKALASADQTRYIVIRAKAATGHPGKIIATAGLTRAPYGVVKFFNRSSKKWEQRYGPFGLSYAELFGRTDMPETLSTALWDAPVPILGMEDYLKVELPRPWKIETVYGPTSEGRFQSAFKPAPGHADPGVDPDLSKPIYFGSGEIDEIVKFYIDPEIENRGAVYTEGIAALLQSLLPEHRPLEYTLNGQFLYTYNPREGVLNYFGQGYKRLTQFPSQERDQTEWHFLGASVPDFVRKVHSSSVTGAGPAEAFVKETKAAVDLFIQTQLQKDLH
jgi:hypothetical protein